MPNPTRITLRVVIPDPGEWCNHVDAGLSRSGCSLYEPLSEKCLCGHVLETRKTLSKFVYGTKRPQSCKDAEDYSVWKYGAVDLGAFRPDEWEKGEPIDFKAAVSIMLSGGLVIYSDSTFCCYSKAFCTFEHNRWWEKQFNGSERAWWFSVRPRMRKDAEAKP